MKLRALIFLSLLSISCIAQNNNTPRCNFDHAHEAYFKSEKFIQDQRREDIAYKDFISTKSQRANTTYTIPVVVHIVKNPDNQEMDITDQEIYRQIEIINECYNLQNTDVDQVPPMFDTLIGNPQIEFCLATVDPNGFSTTGITRTTTDVATFSSVSDNIKHSDLGGVDAWDTDSYLNIWVGKISSGVLGYAHTPTANIEHGEHGLVVGYPYFGETDHSQYGDGKTAVHEIGHYLNLKHPWGFGDCDENNDWVDDTPMSEDAYYGVPVHPQESCGSVDMFMNYMDYVDDEVMVMFSEGQVAKMHLALNFYRDELQYSNGCGTPILHAVPELVHNSSEGANDASISLNINSGIAPFEIEWSNGEITEDINNLEAGTYSVIITDDVGQQITLDFTVGYLGEIIDSDNFESYDIDSLLEVQSMSWAPFCSDNFSANIEDILAPEGVQYLEVNAADGANTFIRTIDGLSTNAYNLTFKLYVPQARAAKYTIYHQEDCDETEVAYEVQFNVDGSGQVSVGGQTQSFVFPQGQWLDIRQLIDLDRDIVELYIAEVKILDWPFEWTLIDEYGQPNLAAIVFNSEIDALGLVHYFIDDYRLSLTNNSDVGVEEKLITNYTNIYPNPASDYIKMTSSVDEECTVVLTNSLGQKLEEYSWCSNSEFKIDLSSYETGLYFIKLEKSTSVELFKFIVSR